MINGIAFAVVGFAAAGIVEQPNATNVVCGTIAVVIALVVRQFSK